VSLSRRRTLVADIHHGWLIFRIDMGKHGSTATPEPLFLQLYLGRRGVLAGQSGSTTAA
jgi:hypothetical protein